jgi:hypothetical protein
VSDCPAPVIVEKLEFGEILAEDVHVFSAGLAMVFSAAVPT